MTTAITFHAFAGADFWIGVGVLAATYGIFSLGLQLNVGTTGITNFGQAGFMAIGAYTMGILVVKEGWSWWWAMPAAIAASMLAAILVGLPSLRLRADYFAITTLAFAEIVRYLADNTRDLTNGSQGLLGYSSGWVTLSVRFGGWLNDHGIHVTSFLFPLLLVSWAVLSCSRCSSPARPHAVGTSPARDPRGRGRCPRAREEHARVQAAVARAGRRARPRSPASSSRST